MVRGATEIPSYPGYYVTRNGRVFSGRFWNGAPKGTENWRERIIGFNGDGYPQVSLMRGGRKYHVAVHRLLAETFLPPRPSPRHQVRHRDGNPKHCHVRNLEWGTAKQNMADRDRHGTTPRGENHVHAKLTDSAVAEIRRRRRAGETLRSIAAAMKVTVAAISGVTRGHAWKHVGDAAPIDKPTHDPRATLTPEQGRKVVEAVRNGSYGTSATLAKSLGVSHSVITRVLRRHGVMDDPKRLNRQKMDATKVAEALQMLASGMNDREVAENFNVATVTILQIRLGRTWRNVPRPQTWRKMTPNQRSERMRKYWRDGKWANRAEKRAGRGVK